MYFEKANCDLYDLLYSTHVNLEIFSGDPNCLVRSAGYESPFEFSFVREGHGRERVPVLLCAPALKMV